MNSLEDMPFLMLLQKAYADDENVGASTANAGVTTTAPKDGPGTTGRGGSERRPRPKRRSESDGTVVPVRAQPNSGPENSSDGAGEAVQMTPELWRRGTLLHRLQNDYSLDLSQPMAIQRGARGSLVDSDDDDTPSVPAMGLTDRFQLGVGCVDEGARASARHPSFASWEDDDGGDAETPPYGDDEILLDTRALQDAMTASPDGSKVDERSQSSDSRAMERAALELALELVEAEHDDSEALADFDRRFAIDHSSQVDPHFDSQLESALDAVNEFDCSPRLSMTQPLENDWLFAATVNESGSSKETRDVHDLSTEVGAKMDVRDAPRPRRRSRRDEVSADDAAPEIPQANAPPESTSSGRLRLPWETVPSSQAWQSDFDDGIMRSSQRPQPPLQSGSRRRGQERKRRGRQARDLFLGAVESYRRGRVAAAHADALVACVFDPDNDTYRLAVGRWAEELEDARDSSAPANPRNVPDLVNC